MIIEDIKQKASTHPLYKEYPILKLGITLKT